MLNFSMVQSVKVLSGSGSVTRIGELAHEAGYTKAFLVFDTGVKKIGIIDRITESLSGSGIGYVEFGDVVPDPPAEIVNTGAAICINSGCDCVIAIGGGSAIDTGKGINILRFNSGSILDYTEKEMLPCSGLITIPTTSGTGSELSNGAIISDPQKNLKIPILCFNCMSEYTIIDPDLPAGMPTDLTIVTGLDVFSHAAEAYTSVLSNIVTDPVCEKIMLDVIEYLPRAIKDGKNIQARSRMHVCSALGGWMLYNSCAHVGHSVAHVIGAYYHIVHGAACAYSFPPVLKLISSAVPEKVKFIGKALGAEFEGKETPEEIGIKTANAYAAFRDEVIGLPPVEKGKIKREDLTVLSKKIVSEPFAGLTPLEVTEEAALSILREVFDIS